MGRYDYFCSNKKCEEVHEEIHGMLEKPVVVCLSCGSQCFKLLSVDPSQIFAANVPLYDFIDRKTTTQPVRIKSKRQWHEHLKRVGQIEASNEVPSSESIVSAERTRKMVAKRELKEAVIASVKDKGHIKQVKQKILSGKGGT